MDAYEVTKEKIITSTQVEPDLKKEDPQFVYDKKKTRLRGNQFIWYILIFIEVLLTFRLILKLSGADPLIGFPRIIYTVTTPLVFPFSTISGSYTSDPWSTIFAGIVYLAIAWGVIYFLHLIYPIIPKNLDTK